MAKKSTASAPREAQQVFRQFAWNLAGTLTNAKSGKPAVRPVRGASAHKKAGTR